MTQEKATPQNLTVLFIDDEELMRDVASMMFEDVGWKSILATGGKNGVDLYKEFQDEIDVSIIDFSMPEMNGIETAQAIRNLKSLLGEKCILSVPKSHLTGDYRGEVSQSRQWLSGLYEIDGIKLHASVWGCSEDIDQFVKKETS